ncbi:MAG: LPS assembly protein LptD [Pseudomonadota bacterium]
MRLLLALLFACLALPLVAQQPSTLIADRVELTPEGLLIAEGNVEIIQGDTRLRAPQVTYNGDTDQLTIEGPIEIRRPGNTVILADQGELSEGLGVGILRSARLVFDQQFQVSAVEMQRVAGRYNQAYKIAATSCHVCGSDRPPLWQIRARRVVHDELERQLYFEHAQLRILDVPVFYLPRLRLPDPSLARSNGFLFPEYTSSSLQGSGLRVPYFFTLGDHADLTVAPWITTESKTLELLYRQEFVNGSLFWNTYISNDDFSGEGTRLGVEAAGAFNLPRAVKLKFDIEALSDRVYFSDYNYSDKDRLDSAISLERTTATEDNFVELVSIRSRRVGETGGTFPGVLLDGYRDLRFQPALGGDALLSFSFNGGFRSSDTTEDDDGDGLSDGLDVTRTGLSLDWRAGTLGPYGVLFDAEALVAGDAFFIADDPNFDSIATRFSSGASIGMRLPMTRTSETGAVHIIEPRVQLAWSSASSDDVPNQDATRVEFDEGNLFALNRAPGFDVIEDGARVNLGLTWLRTGPDGWSSDLTVGRVQRISGSNDFSESSGLSEDISSWIVSGSLNMGQRFDIIGRLLVDDNLDFNKNEFGATYRQEGFTLAGTYAFLAPDLEEDRAGQSSELALRTSYDFNDYFTGRASWRYDFTDSATTRARLGLTYVNECVEIILSASRDFADSGNVSSNTDLSLTVGLRGFGRGSAAERRASSCG